MLFVDGPISGLDFNPLGNLIASFSEDGICLISDVDTDDYRYHLKIGSEHGKLSAYYI